MPYKNHEQQKAYEANYKAAHRQQQNTYNARYRASHREETKVSSAAWRAAHPKEEKASQAANYATHRTEARARHAAWEAAHPVARRIIQSRRRARKKALPATLTIEQWRSILAAYKHRCAYCRKKESKRRPLTQDHVVPLTKGGGTTRENIVPACQPCNSRKSTRPPSQPIQLVLL